MSLSTLRVSSSEQKQLKFHMLEVRFVPQGGTVNTFEISELCFIPASVYFKCNKQHVVGGRCQSLPCVVEIEFLRRRVYYIRGQQ